MKLLTWLLGSLLLAGCATTQPESPGEASDADTRAAVHTELALGYLKRGQKKTALHELHQALEISPSHSQSNYVMAMLQTQLDRPEKANQYYHRALQSEPDNAVAAHDYGIFLCRRGRVEQAMDYFQRALDNPLYERKTLTRLRMGGCLMRIRTDRRGAEPYFREVLEVDPRVPSALYYMADIAYAREDYLSARAYIERYFAVAPETPESLLLAVKIETRLDSAEIARHYAQRLRKQFASSDEAAQLKRYQ